MIKSVPGKWLAWLNRDVSDCALAANANPTKPATDTAAKIVTAAGLGIYNPIRRAIQAATTTANTVVIPLSVPRMGPVMGAGIFPECQEAGGCIGR